MGNKCLVLGGDGFLGSHLVDELLSLGFHVRAFDRFNNGIPRNLPQQHDRLEIFSGDFLDLEDIDTALIGVDFVFHFISLGNPALTIKEPRADIENNILGTVQLLGACVKHGVKKVIYPSSGGAIYGNIEYGVANEEHLLDPITPYSIGKLCIEKYFGYYKRYYDLDYVVYRISNPYGERQSVDGTQGIIPILLRRVLLGESVDIYGDSVRDYIYVKDAMNFIAGNFDKDHKYGIYNLGSGQGESLSQVLTTIESVVQRKPEKKQKEKRPFDVERIVLDIGRVRDEFGFVPKVGFEEGVRMTFDSIRKKIQQSK